MTILVYIMERDVAAYTEQGWRFVRFTSHHGARRNGRNFLAVMEGE